MPSNKSPSLYVHPGTGMPVSGSTAASMAAMAALQQHVLDPIDAHMASAIGYLGGALWADTTATVDNPVQSAIDAIVSTLSLTTGQTGAGKVYKSVSGNWYDATNIPASQMNTWLNRIISDLAASTATDGSGKIGWYSAGAALNWADATTNPTTSVGLQLRKIITDLATVAATDGSGKIGWYQGSNWLDGTTNPATSVGLQLRKIITDLIATASPGGSAKIGGEAETASFSGAPYTLAAKALRLQVQDLLKYINNPSRVRDVLGNTTIDVAGYRDSILAVDSSGGARIITLTAATIAELGRKIRVIDVSGNSETNNITIRPNGTDTINGLNADYVLSANYGQWELTNVSGAWFIK
jgi:hypothetical protein